MDKYLENIYFSIEYLNDRKDTFDFNHFDENSTPQDALRTIQDVYEIIRAGQDVIELLSLRYLGDYETKGDKNE